MTHGRNTGVATQIVSLLVIIVGVTGAFTALFTASLDAVVLCLAVALFGVVLLVHD